MKIIILCSFKWFNPLKKLALQLFVRFFNRKRKMGQINDISKNHYTNIIMVKITKYYMNFITISVVIPIIISNLTHKKFERLKISIAKNGSE